MSNITTGHTFRKWLAAAVLVTFSGACFSGTLPPLIDNFGDNHNNNLGFPRLYMNDSIAGGSTQTEQTTADGILSLSGALVPPRGQPGWASTILPLDAQGLPRDASDFDGIRLIIKVTSGNVSISANSTEVTNFDYHSAPISVAADGKFHEVQVPFNSMKRGWSEQTPLNIQTLASVSITAYSLKKERFEYEIDEVRFYRN